MTGSGCFYFDITHSEQVEELWILVRIEEQLRLQENFQGRRK